MGMKIPHFDGTKEKWPFYKKKMVSYIARLGLEELLDDSAREIVLKDLNALPT